MSISQFDVFAMLGADFVDYSFLPATNTCGGVLTAVRGPSLDYL